MPLLEIPEQTPSSDIDEDIIEIFAEEVEEVHTEIVTNFKVWKNDHNNTESLKTLRRCFHTLKGSGRLVGATVIGELGWRFENMLNRVINGTLSVNNDLLGLIEQVDKVLANILEQFQRNQPVPYEIVLLISQADYLAKSKGQSSLGDFDSANEKVKTEDTPPVQAESSQEIISSPDDILGETEKATELTKPDDILNETEKSTELTKDELELGVEEILESEIEELDDLPETLELETGNLPESLDLEIEELGELPEDLLEIKELDDKNLEDLETGELPENLELESIELPEDLKLETIELPEYELELETAPIDEISYQTIDLSSDEDTGPTTVWDDFETIDPQLFEIFKTEASENISELKKFFNNKKLISHIEQDVERAFHTLNGSSRSVNFLAIAEIAAPMEKYARFLLERQVELTPGILVFFNDAILLIENLLNDKPVDKVQQKTLLERVEISLKSLPGRTQALIPPLGIEEEPVEEKVEEETDEAVEEEGTDSKDEFMATDEFMVLFFEEADEILENTQSLLERWTATPKNMQLMKELQRELHTLKGGARMVGIAPMGELSHHLESVLTRIVEGTAQSSPKLQEIVQNSVDELAAMLAAIRSSVPLDMPEDLIGQINAALASDEEERVEEPVKESATPAVDVESQKTSGIKESKPGQIEKEVELVEGTEDRIRVKASLIDKLTNLAGELSISRAHMEQQQGSIKSNLIEMEQTVMRLRDQLRRFEIETEAQIISHFGGTSPGDDEEFDLLELDRFSVMQQLSRSLMESVNDLTNIQDFLKNLTRQSDSLLIQQSRIGAELQEGIMRTRMVPFTIISPRLQRIARLTARELHKQVEFVINGEEIEFERTVLNRIVAPLEHMLRNAIDHGTEDAKTRQQAGKASIAKIIVDLSKEGAELIIKLSDDGAGLNMQKIRKKAEERGLIKPKTVINDDDLIAFILEHGFSTADRLTPTSGRGVGMDVAYSEIKQLGGSLRIHSKMGKGTQFEIRLPLSLTITQALLVHIGEETMAVPLNHVDAVMRTPRAEFIGKADEVHYYEYMDHSYRVFHLGELLRFSQVASENNPLVPMLLVRAADRRMALLVDGIEGSKEIVVKSVGPQIGTIRWLAGATILGDGRVVLILDLPTLARVDTIPQSIPQPVEVVEEEKPTIKTIMIVDDSITVRKVTARFLKRQGMEVLTAKDGLDAIAQLQEHIPDLMLLDVEMPRMDGYELATQVRHRSDLKHLPIIMITSRTGTKHRDKAKKIGINRYLGKPFNETELLENIRALLAETRCSSFL